MSDQREGGIGWTDETWNPVRGCSRVSAGCENCYAERVAARFSGPGQPYEGLAIRKLKTLGEDDETARVVPRWTGEVRLVPEHLADPLRWKRPRRIFVNSMSDLFHERLSFEDIARVWAVMLLSPRHTFQVLTKRAERMRAVLSDLAFYDAVLEAAAELRGERPDLMSVGISNPSLFPAKWIWAGVSVEDQRRADERIPLLLETPAAVRFVSAEPLLGPVDISEYLDPAGAPCGESSEVLDWVIVGCESGPGARPMDEDWVRSLRDLCAAAGVPFFNKQAMRDGKLVQEPFLDGVQHLEFPR